MQYADAFAGLHPAVDLVYFLLVIGSTMLLGHPVCLLISLGSAALYAWRLHCRKLARLVVPLMVLTALVNPAFSHAGATILAYFPNGNPLTLESILYGLSAGAMLGSVLLWFACYQRVMTSDKFVYLFGRVIPSLSLLLSMALRFVPRLRQQAKQISDAQRLLEPSATGLRARLRRALSVFSALVSWSLEGAVETADSMKSRGYGLPGRTAFSIYRFDRRDRRVLCALVLGGVYLAVGAALGAVRWRYYPTVKGAAPDLGVVSVWVVYAALCLMPLWLDGKEALSWKHSRSAI